MRFPFNTGILFVWLCSAVLSGTALHNFENRKTTNNFIHSEIQDHEFKYIRFADEFCAKPGVLDQSCIQNAIAGSATVFVPDGRYEVASTILLNGAGMTLECSSGALIVGKRGFIAAVAANSVSIRGCTFDGGTRITGDCINLSLFDNVTFEHNQVHNCYGGKAVDGTRNSHLTIRFNQFTNVGLSTPSVNAPAIQIHGVNGSSFDIDISSNSFDTSSTGARCVQIASTKANNTIARIRLFNNYCLIGPALFRGSAGSCRNLNCDTVTAGLETVYNGGVLTDVSVVGNMIIVAAPQNRSSIFADTTVECIDVGGSNTKPTLGAVITGNTCRGTGFACIDLEGISGAVTGNGCYETGETLIDDDASLTYSGNIHLGGIQKGVNPCQILVRQEAGPSQDVIITNNTLVGPEWNGICISSGRVKALDGFIISNNSIDGLDPSTRTTIDRPNMSGIRIEHSTNGTVSGNVVRNFNASSGGGTGIWFDATSRNVHIGPNQYANNTFNWSVGDSPSVLVKEHAGAAFNSLSRVANGSRIFCTDCGSENGKCHPGGSGTIASRKDGQWVCD